MEQDISARFVANQNNYLTRNRLEKTLDKHAKYIGSCDGQSRSELRKWITGFDQTAAWVEGADDKAIVEMMAPLITGPLATFLTQLKKRADASKTVLTWGGIKAEIKKTFLAINEDDLLREEVQKLVQREYEEVQAYTQRFKEALRLGYSDTEQAVGIIKTQLIQKYVDGLRDHNLRRDVYREEPDDLDKAYTAAAKAERALSRANAGGPPQLPLFQSSQREEEPMEIGATGSEPGLAEVNQTLRRMEKRMEKDGKRLDALEQRFSRPSRGVSQQNWRPHNSQQNQQRYRSGTQCYNCGKFGHMARECRGAVRKPTTKPAAPSTSKN